MFAARAEFLVETLNGILITVFLEYFTILRGVSRAMQQACFINGSLIAPFFRALACAALLRFGRRVGFNPFSFPDITRMVGICPMIGYFRRCFYFVDLFQHLHAFKRVACIHVGTPLKAPSM